MKRLAYLFLLLILFQSCSTGTSEQGNVSEENDLPVMSVQMSDGTFQPINKLQGKTILVLFQPGCDHCQREATSMSEHLDRFKDYQVYFISSATSSDNAQFATDYGLAGASNFQFGTTTADHIVQHFGSIPTPSVYIYSEQGKLVNEFIGETPIDQILEVI